MPMVRSSKAYQIVWEHSWFLHSICRLFLLHTYIYTYIVICHTCMHILQLTACNVACCCVFDKICSNQPFLPRSVDVLLHGQLVQEQGSTLGQLCAGAKSFFLILFGWCFEVASFLMLIPNLEHASLNFHYCTFFYRMDSTKPTGHLGCAGQWFAIMAATGLGPHGLNTDGVGNPSSWGQLVSRQPKSNGNRLNISSQCDNGFLFYKIKCLRCLDKLAKVQACP